MRKSGETLPWRLRRSCTRTKKRYVIPLHGFRCTLLLCCSVFCAAASGEVSSKIHTSRRKSEQYNSRDQGRRSFRRRTTKAKVSVSSVIVDMESEQGNHDNGGGVGAKPDGEENSPAESKTETPAPVSENLTVDAENKSDEVPDPSKGTDVEAEAEGGAPGSGSKEDQTHAEGETGNSEPQSLETDGVLQQNQTGSADTGEVDDKNPTVETKMQTNSDAKDVGTASNDPVKESSLPVSSSLLQTEESDIKTKKAAIAEEKEGGITGGADDQEGDSGKNVGDHMDEGAKGSLVRETEKSIEDVSPEDQKTKTAPETDKAPIAMEVDIAEKEKEATIDDQHNEKATESMGEKIETVGNGGAELSADEPHHNTKDQLMSTSEEDAKPKTNVETPNTESNEKGENPDKEDGASTKLTMDLVQSNDVKVDSAPLLTTSSPADNTDVKMEEKENKDDTFVDFEKKKVRVKKKAKKKKKSIKIKITGMSTEIARTKLAGSGASMIPTPDTFGLSLPGHPSLIPHDLDVVEKELEDSLEFFERPHEDQDPMYTEFINKEKRDRITLTLKNLKVEEESGKKEIGLIVNQQLKDKQGSTERYIEKHRLKIAADQKNDLTRLQQSYTTKSRSNKGKIDHGIAVLRKKHSDETQKYLQQHRQQVQQRRIPEQMASAEWAQIAQRVNAKHSRQMHDFSRKGKEVMNKCKVEYERERTRITKVYEKRIQDLNSQRQSLYNRIYSTLQQIRQRHLKKHLQSIADRRKAMELELASTHDQKANESADNLDKTKQSSHDKAKSGSDERLDLRPVSPIKTATAWREESAHEPSGAATRHKHRKGVLSQINRQLSVEIHNEGIWLSEISEKKSSQNRSKDSSETAATESDKKYFFPWGVKARKILESIVCGEIPDACDSLKLNFSETVAQNGGHLRCVMTDLRTSDGTASAQRAEAIMKKELGELKKMEERETGIKKNMVEMEKNMDIIKKQQHDLGLKLKETLKDYDKTKQHLQAFRTKYSSFFGPDGKPLPTNDPNDTRKLTQHGMKYKMAIESSEKRGIAIKTKISELQASLQRRETNHKTGQRAISSLNAAIKSKRNVINEVKSGRLNLLQAKSVENPTTRVKETINILGLTADMRRDQLNQKRNSNTSSHWVQSLPGVPGPLRRSLWYKMHRRRQQIVLRPTFSSMLSNMRNEIESKMASTDTSIRRTSKEAIEDKLIEAEKLYLLVTHPAEKLNENLSSLPSSSAWAEPGWYLKLDVEKDDCMGDRILPCPPKQPLVQYNLSELYSAPGRQAASMINSTHLRSLETPLSAVATATSLSETDPAMAKSADPILSSNDPLKMTRDALKLGYAFSVNKTQAVRPSVTRRKSSSTKETAPIVSTKGTKKKQTVSTTSDSGVSKASGAPAKVNAPRVDSRKRKNTTQSNSTSTPRAVQRKRTEPPRQIPVDDQAFQPRPIMTQPQQQQQPTQPSAPFVQQAMPQHQQNPYNNQFINTMPSPVAPQQQATHRASFNQFQNTPQMNQFRMMQQQQSHHQQQQHHQQHPNQQNVNYGQIQQQPMRPNPQFFPQLGQQQFPQQTMQMPGQGGMQMNIQGHNQVRQNLATSDEQNDPLFMLKEM